MHPWVQTGVVTSSQPGEVEVDRADDVAGEDGARVGADGHVSFNGDGRRRLCRTSTSENDEDTTTRAQCCTSLTVCYIYSTFLNLNLPVFIPKIQTFTTYSLSVQHLDPV